MKRIVIGAAVIVALWTSVLFAESDPVVTINPMMTKGPASAPVTIVEFADYQCQYCKKAQPVLDQILKEFSGKIRLVYKDFPLPNHTEARAAAEAARCAGAQGRYWEYHDLLFVGQPEFSRTDLITYATRLALSTEDFTACLDSGRFREAIQEDLDEARMLGVSRTPTFLINGERVVGAETIHKFRYVVGEALKKAEQKSR